MSDRAGVELTPLAVRVVLVAPFTGRVTRTAEVPWEPSRPADAVAALRDKLGQPASVALTIGLGFLQVKRVDLPPVPAAERTRIVELEPDRYLAAASREAFVITLAPDAPIAFGVPSAMIDGWITAFEAWAPVEWVEPAPLSVSRALGGRDGTWRVDAAVGEVGVLKTEAGRLASVRRAPHAPVDGAPREIPAIGSTSGALAAALGVARWQSRSARAIQALAPGAWRQRAAAKQRARLLGSTIAGIAGILLATWSADLWRSRTLAALDARITALETRAAPADTALRMLRSREMEAATIRDVAATRADPLAALATISAALPREATVLSARANGNDWQVDGTTSDASVLVPLLDRHAAFDSVRFLTASSRYRDGNRSYETFSIALRFRSQP